MEKSTHLFFLVLLHFSSSSTGDKWFPQRDSTKTVCFTVTNPVKTVWARISKQCWLLVSFFSLSIYSCISKANKKKKYKGRKKGYDIAPCSSNTYWGFCDIVCDDSDRVVWCCYLYCCFFLHPLLLVWVCTLPCKVTSQTRQQNRNSGHEETEKGTAAHDHDDDDDDTTLFLFSTCAFLLSRSHPAMLVEGTSKENKIHFRSKKSSEEERRKVPSGSLRFFLWSNNTDMECDIWTVTGKSKKGDVSAPKKCL